MIPQTILDELTDVDMPKLPPTPDITASVTGGGCDIGLVRAGTVVVGSGAAGLRAAVELKRRGQDVVIISQSAWGGTSACSGSDKQTLHTANTADQGDNFQDMARALQAGGAMDGDTAYIEAVGSPRAMASLQFLGLPLPQDPFGGVLRYQTDHDETGRATSCGPRTSRLMVKVLAQEALRLEIAFFNLTTAVRVVKEGGKVVGVLAMQNRLRCPSNPLGLLYFHCHSLVLAAGGPGELYRDSVFPNGCFGSLGLALEAGVNLVNLTESQFGIGTRREGFPWNLSGTYMQAMPHVYSVDRDGQEHHFLAGYYRTTQELASNLFRKGYQWPFHATRMSDFGSSLVDLAIHQECALGRRVYMDFNRNPLAADGDGEFSLDQLDPDVTLYLRNAGADHAQPIDRLRHMNPLSIELYRRYKIDIAQAPLEFAVNNQHMNGGIAVDSWGRSSVPGLYAVGEAAGTHGVTRPGGSALNAGQVFGTRVAEHIGAAGRGSAIGNPGPELGQAIGALQAVLKPDSPISAKTIRQDVQARMSDKAGILCRADVVRTAHQDARALNRQIAKNGIGFARASEMARALQWQQMALASEAVLAALDFYIGQGGGSRGARAVLDPEGQGQVNTRQGPLEALRYRKERQKDQREQIHVRLEGGEIRVATRPNREFDDSSKAVFERDWPDWLLGTIYDLGTREEPVEFTDQETADETGEESLS
ncbi:MAG: FAD-binding protein [Pelagimonas sp.]|uniref:FAD-binding protein n=1 Tax=Pelagimonas sp. TaxID=2073170 RepID=UPI003D6C6E68